MNNENNSFDNIDTNIENTKSEERVELTQVRYGRASKGLSIASLVISIITVAVAIISIYLCIESIRATTNPDNNPGTAIGGGFAAVFMVIFSLPCIGVSVVSLGLGIGALANRPSKSSKNIGIIGVILSAVSIIACVLALILRTAIQ